MISQLLRGFICPFRFKNATSLFRSQRYEFTASTKAWSTHSQPEISTEDELVIPKYVHRSPTDILQALNQTVARDATAAGYLFHDDPYLIPANDYERVHARISREAGRTAANWVRNNNIEIFDHTTGQPQNQVFSTGDVLTEATEVDESVLLAMVEQARVSDAVTVYRKLQKNDVDVSGDTLQSLLELLCFYNGQDGVPEENIEERKRFPEGPSVSGRVWKDDGIAEEVFRGMDPPSSRAFNSLVKGMLKYGQFAGAKSTWDKMLQMGFEPGLDTYNSMISMASHFAKNHEGQWQYGLDLLADMSSRQISPDVGTLNATLQILQHTGAWRDASTLALRAWREFQDARVSPSLASYYHLLEIFYCNSVPLNDLLDRIMDQLDGKSFTIQHPSDTNFFSTAMKISSHQLKDADLALRIDGLLHSTDNYRLIGNWTNESTYFRDLFTLMFHSQTPDDFMANYYSLLVPNIYMPELGTMTWLVRTLRDSGGARHIPRIWTDSVLLGHVRGTQLVAAVLSAAAADDSDDTALHSQLAHTCWDVLERVEANQERKIVRGKARGASWTGEMLGDVILVQCRAGQLQRAASVLQRLERDQTFILGVPRLPALQSLFQLAMSEQDQSTAGLCARYTSDVGFPDGQRMMEDIAGSPDSNDSQLLATGHQNNDSHPQIHQLDQ